MAFKPPRLPRTPAPSPTYVAETAGVTVRVRPGFLAEESSRSQGRFIWSYTVEIENRSAREIQLISRRWVITDGLNRTETVRGQGVAGEQPSLKPGEAYRYASACPLETTSGLMSGAYQMLSAEGELFEVEIPTFSLDLPKAELALN
ncbi:MAG: Co2+/Mg2+ efflux protein ApaG [Caulobacteraceae bacterium]